VPGCAIWFVGLPGSGKSSVARCAFEYCQAAGYDVLCHEMDKRRRKYFPNPQYTAEERAKAYSMFIDEAVELVARGKVVLMDASAHKAAIRNAARKRIERFAEIMIKCELLEAMRREKARPAGLVMADMYEKALKRRETGEQFAGLGEVIGVDVPFEEANAELTVDNTGLSLDETCRIVIAFLDTWLDNA